MRNSSSSSSSTSSASRSVGNVNLNINSNGALSASSSQTQQPLLHLHQLPIRGGDATNTMASNNNAIHNGQQQNVDSRVTHHTTGNNNNNNNNNNSSSGGPMMYSGGAAAAATATLSDSSSSSFQNLRQVAGTDHRPDVEFAHEQVKNLIERNKQYYETELSRREVYIEQLQSDFRHNLAVAQEHENENERLRLEVDELNRELGRSERTVKELAETNGALSESCSRLKVDLDEVQRKAESTLGKARSDAASNLRSFEAEQARLAGETKTRELALKEEHEHAIALLKQQHSELEHMLHERVASLEQDRTQLEEKVSLLERKNSALSSEKTSSTHGLAVVRKREEELENRLREAMRKCDTLEMEASRLRDENIALAVEKDSRKAEWQDSLDAKGRSQMERMTTLTMQCSKLTQSEKSLRDIVASLKDQLEHERAARRKESDEADLRILAMKKEVDSARDAAAVSASSSQKDLHDERRKIVEELNDQLAEALKQTRRADDLQRRVMQAQFEAQLAQQRIDALSSELSSQREQFRADTLRLQQLHQEDGERWNAEAAKLRRNLSASDDARKTLEAVIQDHVERERRDAASAVDAEKQQHRIHELEHENEQVRAVVREVTKEMNSAEVLINVKQQAVRIVTLEAELARSKNQCLELDVRLQAAEMELREETAQHAAKQQQFADTVKALSSDAATLRQMLQDERGRKSSFVDATLAGVSKWTMQATSLGGGGSNHHQSQHHHPTTTTSRHPQSAASSSARSSADNKNMDDFVADAAAASLADRLDTQSLQHELARLELVVSMQQKQLSELVSQRAQHVAQIADLKSMFEAVSQDRQSLSEMNNALRMEARAAEGEVARLRGEVQGLRGALVKVRGQSALDRVRSPTRGGVPSEQQQQHAAQMQHQQQQQSQSASQFPPGKMTATRNPNIERNVAGNSARATLAGGMAKDRRANVAATTGGAAAPAGLSVSSIQLSSGASTMQHRRSMSGASTGSGNQNNNNNAIHRRAGHTVRNYNVVDGE